MQIFDEGHGYDLFGLAPGAVKRALRLALPIYRHYFRVQSLHVERVPRSGGAILVPNHSGLLPIDAALLWTDIAWRTDRVLRPIADRFIPRLPFISTLFARTGVVAGTHANVRHLLARGELIAIFPEGTSGPAKPFSERYHLQDWRVGHAEHAIRARVPIVPVAIVGLEEAWPILVRVPWRPFGAPYWPVPAVPLPLPVQVTIHYGHPIELHRRYPDPDEPTIVAAAAREIRGCLESML